MHFAGNAEVRRKRNMLVDERAQQHALRVRNELAFLCFIRRVPAGLQTAANPVERRPDSAHHHGGPNKPDQVRNRDLGDSKLSKRRIHAGVNFFHVLRACDF